MHFILQYMCLQCTYSILTHERTGNIRWLHGVGSGLVPSYCNYYNKYIVCIHEEQDCKIKCYHVVFNLNVWKYFILECDLLSNLHCVVLGALMTRLYSHHSRSLSFTTLPQSSFILSFIWPFYHISSGFQKQTPLMNYCADICRTPTTNLIRTRLIESPCGLHVTLLHLNEKSHVYPYSQLGARSRDSYLSRMIIITISHIFA